LVHIWNQTRPEAQRCGLAVGSERSFFELDLVYESLSALCGSLKANLWQPAARMEAAAVARRERVPANFGEEIAAAPPGRSNGERTAAFSMDVSNGMLSLVSSAPAAAPATMGRWE